MSISYSPADYEFNAGVVPAIQGPGKIARTISSIFSSKTPKSKKVKHQIYSGNDTTMIQDNIVNHIHIENLHIHR